MGFYDYTFGLCIPPLGTLIHEKTWSRKSRVRLPLTCHFLDRESNTDLFVCSVNDIYCSIALIFLKYSKTNLIREILQQLPIVLSVLIRKTRWKIKPTISHWRELGQTGKFGQKYFTHYSSISGSVTKISVFSITPIYIYSSRGKRSIFISRCGTRYDSNVIFKWTVRPD
jgi:hypothetical protein